MSPIFTLVYHVYFFHGAVQYLLFQHCYAMSTLQRLYVISTFSTLLRFVSCDKSTVSTLLRYVYIFPRCCAISTIPCFCAMSTFSTLLCFVSFSTQLRHVYSFHAAAQCLLFHGAAPYLRLQHCCSTPPFSTLLSRVYFFHAVASCLLRHCCSFHTAALCLLFPRCYTMSIELCIFFLPCCGILFY